jgi:hypothetical protein
MATFKFIEFLTPEAAKQHIVDRHIVSISSEMTIVNMNMADVIGKIDNLFSKDSAHLLNEDQVLYLKAIRENYAKTMSLTESAQKSI